MYLPSCVFFIGGEVAIAITFWAQKLQGGGLKQNNSMNDAWHPFMSLVHCAGTKSNKNLGGT
jgi:hypothetical protein